MVPSMPLVHALIGLTSWAVVLLGLERWHRHSGRDRQTGVSEVADEAEEWLRAQDSSDGGPAGSDLD
jgi:hypothetical protein